MKKEVRVMDVFKQAPAVERDQGGEKMLAPQEVQKMLALKALGWGSKRISQEMGCSRNTVREYLRQGEWKPMDVSARASVLEPHREWLAERLRRHHGNADVVRQDLERELGVVVTLRTVQRALEPLRRGLRAEALATVRYETAPGQQLQIDFGSTAVIVGDETLRVHLFVATLGYSRRCFVGMFLHERQSAWLQGLEGAFRHFGGVPHELLLDNARALVDDHNVQTREVKFNDRFHAFCRYWGVVPRACAPYRARTKGKDERGVGYVKRNAIAGHRFDSIEALQCAPAALDARGGRHPGARHHRRGADHALRARRGEGTEAATGQGAVPAGARGHAAGAHRRLHRTGHQPLQRAVAAHRRERDRHRGRAPSARAACGPGRRHARAKPAAPLDRDRSQPLGGHRRGELRRRDLAGPNGTATAGVAG